jgi:hypothetical protein
MPALLVLSLQVLAAKVAADYGIQRLPPIEVTRAEKRPGVLGTVVYTDSRRILRLHIVARPRDGRETVDTVCHELWHVKQIQLGVDHVFRGIPLLDLSETLRRGYSPNKSLREGEAFYMARITVPRYLSWSSKLD